MLQFRLGGPANALTTKASANPLVSRAAAQDQGILPIAPVDPTIDPATGQPYPTQKTGGTPSDSTTSRDGGTTTKDTTVPPALDTLTTRGSGSITKDISTFNRSGTVTAANVYACKDNVCTGTGLYDLQFHQLQDLLNKVNQKIRAMSGGKYLGPSLTVDGHIDVNTVYSLRAISDSGYTLELVFFDVPLTPDFVAANVSDLIKRAQRFIDGSSALTDKGGISSNTHDTTVSVLAVCPDGVTKVSDPALCPASTGGSPTGGSYVPPPSLFICPDGTQVSDMSYCPASGGGGSGGGGSDPGIVPPDQVMTVAPQVVGLSKSGWIAVGIGSLALGIGIAVLSARSS